MAKAELIASIEFGAKASDVGPGIQRLDRENEALTAERDRIVGGSVSLAIVHGLRSKIFRDGRASIAAAADAKTELGERFDALDVEQQRDLVRGLLTITLHKGRGIGRLR